jgi:nucleoid-associated protein YgaU
MSFTKAQLTNSVTGVGVEVLFNPEEYTINRETNFAQLAVPGLSAPLVQFVNGQAQTLELELLVDSYEANPQADAGSDVRRLTERIASFMDIDPTLHAPPPLVFMWSDALSFQCVLQRLSQRFVMFTAEGVPVRARLQATFSEFRNVDLEAKEIKRETADFTKLHTVTEGDSLPAIAASVYGDATLWRPIALRNEIDDPRTLDVGSLVAIPRLPYRDRESGAILG